MFIENYSCYVNLAFFIFFIFSAQKKLGTKDILFVLLVFQNKKTIVNKHAVNHLKPIMFIRLRMGGYISNLNCKLRSSNYYPFTN